MEKKEVKYYRNRTRQQALADADPDAITFPTDATSIIVGKKEYGKPIPVDEELNDRSVNPVQNKVVTTVLSSKFAGIAFVDGKLKLYADAEKTQLIEEITLGSTSYVISQGNDTESGFYILSGEASHIITFTPSTLSSAFGTQAPFVENYNIAIDVKNGNADYKPIAEATVQAGKSFAFDVRPNVTIGANSIRVLITGQTSNVTSEIEYTCTLTNLTFSCNFSWWKAWVGGEQFVIDNINFYGNLAKTLHVLIDGSVEFTQSFSASTNYNTSSYSFPISQRWNEITTGIHTLEMWMEGGGAKTESVKYNVMVVTAGDAATAKLVVINEVKDSAKNYDANTSLFGYATYNTNSVFVNVYAEDSDQRYTLVNNESLAVESTQTKVEGGYSLPMSIESYDQSDNFKLYVELSTSDGNKANVVVPVDNSESYAPTANANVFFNCASRNNGQSNREVFMNDGNGVKTYNGTFTDFAWNNDGYTRDKDGNVCLKVMAGSTVVIPDLKPLALAQTGSTAIEFMFRASDVADYDTPVFSIMSTNEYDEASTTGIIVFPTQIKVLSTSERRHTYQSYNLTEDEILHVVIVFHRNYSGTGNNICRIYVNACPVTNFEYSGTASFGSGPVRMGQPSADFCLYMFRTYNFALEPNDVLANLLNAVIENNEYSRVGLRNDNAIIDGGSISYELAKQKGFNCFVVETDEELPSFDNQTTLSNIALRFEYADNPEWNVRVSGVPMDGQGTTSMQYFRWNLRSNNKNADAVWEYPNYIDRSRSIKVEVGKDGYLFGYGNGQKISKITAKKNVASSSQGHKMGATALYNDLWHKFFDSTLSTTHAIPSTDTRVAVLQYPFLGFKMGSDGGYQFIGLYTIGADKTDKKTFGYNKTADYPSLMMIEGPNHAPRMTRFLTPWVDVEYDATPKQETLKCGGQEGWDADIVADYSSDKASDKNAIQALYESEFKPAYDFIFKTSPYIRSLASTGKTIAQINADVETFQKGNTNGLNNELLSLYDSSYDLWYYRIATGQYERLDGFNLKTDLGSYLTSPNPTEAEIQSACEAKFKAEITNYVNIDEALFHRCFTILIGASDNDAKNTYWRKFATLANGGRWGFNQDDLDTILPSDNNGQSTKSYSIEPLDTTANGDEVFQGQTSAFWTRISISYENEIRAVMSEIISYMDEIARENNLNGSTLHERILKVFSLYFWDKAAKYFPAIAYAEDTEFAYLTPWVLDHNKTYNSVEPLTQALGTQYDAELIWVQRRIAYIFSRYRLGGLGSATNEYGQLTFTPSTQNEATFKVKPAIDFYPRESRGGDAPKQGARTKAGEICEIVPSSDGATTFYLLGLNWYTEIGDLSGLVLTSRGGSSDTAITFEVTAERLRKLKVGDADASKVKFNATSLNVSGNALESIDARNAALLQGNQDLMNCPRLREVLFSGTKVTQLLLPIGSKINKVSMPSTITDLFLYALPLLKQSNIMIDGYSNIRTMYVNNCDNLNPIALLRSIMESEDSKLKFVTLIWAKDVYVDSNDVEFLGSVASKVYDETTGEGYGATIYNPDNKQISTSAQKPIIEGKIDLGGKNVYESSITAITNVFNNLSVTNIGEYYIPFAEQKVLNHIMIKTDWYGHKIVENDGIGVTYSQAAAAVVPDARSSFNLNNTDISSFDEFQYFTSVEYSVNFSGCSNLKSVKFPQSLKYVETMHFYNCKSLTKLDFSNTQLELIKDHAFQYASALKTILLPNTLKTIEQAAFQCGVVSIEIPDSVTSIGKNLFDGNSSTTSVEWTSGLDTIPEYTFNNCSNLTTLTGIDHVTSIQPGAFVNCKKLQMTSLPPNIQYINSYSFDHCESVSFAELPESLVSDNTSSNASAMTRPNFRYCTGLTSLRIPSSWTQIPSWFVTGSSNLESLTNVDIRIDYIGSWAFQKCSKLTSPIRIGDNNAVECQYIFSECSALTEVHIGNLPNATSVDYMFNGCTSITKIEIGNMPVVNSAVNLFNHCDNLMDLSVGDFSNATDISSAFGNCRSLKSIVLGNFPRAINSHHTFNYCLTVTKISIGNFSLSENTSQMFSNCSLLEDLTIGDFSGTINAELMFGYCGKLPSITIGNLPKVENTHNMFASCSSLVSVSIGNMPKLTNAEQMFATCTRLVNLTIGDISKVTNTTNMFTSCNALENLTINGMLPKTSISFGYCRNLTPDSVQNIIDALPNATGNTLTIHATAKDSYNASSLASMNGTIESQVSSKGWMLA